MNPLVAAVAQLKEARYVAPPSQAAYVDLVEDLATELAWHLQTLGIEWSDIAQAIEAAPIPQVATFEMGVTTAISKLREG